VSDYKDFDVRTEGVTADEVIEDYWQSFTPHGNDLDLLTQSMLLLEAGHYRQALELAVRVQPESGVAEDLPNDVDKHAAQAAFVSAAERAHPLYEQAALEIEGKVDGSSTMMNYFVMLNMLNMLKEDSKW
jgi:hypothetical protein